MATGNQLVMTSFGEEFFDFLRGIMSAGKLKIAELLLLNMFLFSKYHIILRQEFAFTTSKKKLKVCE